MNKASERRWNRLADFLLGQRSLGVVFVVLAAAAIACFPLLQFDFSPQTLFDSNSERARIYEEYRATYGADDHILSALLVADLNQPEAWQVMARIEERLASEIAGIESMVSPLTLEVPQSLGPGQLRIAPLADAVPGTSEEAQQFTKLATGHPLIGKAFIADDGSATTILLKVHDDIARLSDVKPVVRGIRTVLEEETEGREMKAYLLGPHAYRVVVVGIMIQEEFRFLPLTGLVLALVLFAVFRSASGVLIPLLSVFLGAIWTVAAMAITGESINIINTITATLVLVIGVADAIHMMTRYGYERRAGQDRTAAMRKALSSVGAACFLTSMTTAIAFLTLLSAHLGILRHFGFYAALGVMITFGMTIVFVPWALVRSPIDPVVRNPGAREERPSRLDRFLRGQAELIIRRPRTIAVTGGLLVLIFAAGIPQTRVDNFILEYVPRKDELLEAHRILEEKLAGIVYVETLLEVEGEEQDPWHNPDLLGLAAQSEQSILSHDGVQSTWSVLSLLREVRYVVRGGEAGGTPRDQLPQSRAETAQLLFLAEQAGGGRLIENHLSEDRRVLRLTARASDLGARTYLQLEDKLRAQINAAFADSPVPVTVTVTGTSQVGYGGIDSLIRDLLTSLGWAFGLIFITLIFLFRSTRTAALAMVPNLVPVIVVLGSLGWIGKHLEMLSAMVFSIGLGIAVDDTIHFLARYRSELRDGRSPEDAVRRTVEQTGRAIVHTSLVLLVGFGVLFTSSFPPNRTFSVLAGAMIFAALLADLYLLPALLLWFRPSFRGNENRNTPGSEGTAPTGP
ncbi:MAG: MMPL family transporter [Myxococcota bacterium]|nr:MMPL family transporter [Myxococcota bacterium]